MHVDTNDELLDLDARPSEIRRSPILGCSYRSPETRPRSYDLANELSAFLAAQEPDDSRASP